MSTINKMAEARAKIDLLLSSSFSSRSGPKNVKKFANDKDFFSLCEGEL